MRAADVSVWRSRALLMGQVTTVLCGLAAVWLLAEVLLDAGRPASVRVAFRPVTNWPEIKRGGPELSTLNSADELPGSSASPVNGNLRTTIENTVQLPAELTAPRRADETTSGAESMQGLTAPVSSSNHEAKSSVPLVVSNGPSGANATAEPDAVVESNVGSASPVVTAAVAAPSVSPTRAGPELPTRPREKAAPGDPQRRGTNPQQAPSRAQQSLSTTALQSGEAPKLERRSQKRPSAQPTRIAAAQQQVPLAPSVPRGTEDPDPDNNRISLLGIPVPTGTELKQCLLEFRC